MRPSLRFLALALFGWAGLRATTTGMVPGAELFRVQPSQAKAPPIAATQFPPIDPIEPAPQFAGMPSSYGQVPPTFSVQVQPVRVPVYYAAAPASWGYPPPVPAALPTPRPHFYAPIPALDEWPLSRIAAASMPPRRSEVIAPMQSTPAATLSNRIDRLQLTAWALLRGRQGQLLGTPSLATGGTLGGSQAGARLSYSFTRQIAASLRTTSEVGRRGGEVALGARIQPLASLPIWFTAERRQRLGTFGGGRNAFALFAEGGVYQRPMPWHFSLDAYLQGGVVGIRSRDAFVDGGLTLTRPVYRQFSGGVGVWGAAQPGVSRLDAGPRVSMKVRNNVRVHFDWRQKLAGNAQPGSGPAVTLAGDF